MSFQVSLGQLVELLAATPLHLSEHKLRSPITQITTDSRSLQPGDLFIALRGEKFDGHGFVAQTVDRGAIAAVTDYPVVGSVGGNNLPMLVVKDTLVAYQAIAHWWRQQFHQPVIAVTGSVGKTTTKELIASVLATQGKVLRTQANYNNEIGVPKTLLELADQDYAVVEMGMRGKGEIALLAQIARPDVAVITNVGTAHIERLGSEQAIADAKCELLQELPETGVAILNHDNLRLIATAAKVWQGRVLTYGLEGGDLHGELLDSGTLKVEDTILPLPLPGRHNALNYLAAIAVAKVLGIDWKVLTDGLAVALPQGRSQRYELPNDVVLLDETYNAGLESMIAALHLLAETPGTRRIAVLGTMRELGDRSVEFHEQVGRVARQLNLDRLLIFADEAEAQSLAAGAAPSVVSERFASHGAVVERLGQLVQPGDRLLFKASRAVGLDQVVEQFRAKSVVGSGGESVVPVVE
jgi:UDP-N-acetylmuramoyl-tripeptide--D-alanyl-D-alanine ligase